MMEESNIKTVVATEQEWEEAAENVRYCRKLYLEIPVGMFGAVFLKSLLDRYDAGERSEDLFESMMSAE